MVQSSRAALTLPHSGIQGYNSSISCALPPSPVLHDLFRVNWKQSLDRKLELEEVDTTGVEL